MLKGKFDKKEITINIIAIMIVLILIAVLTKFITNRKQATYVENEISNVAINTSQTERKSETKNENNNDTYNIIVTNSTENSTTNAANANNTSNEVNTNTEVNNTSAENNTNTAQSVTPQEPKKEEKKSDTSKSVNGVIFLTFDDGPSANITPKVLDILKKENIKATFFVINYSDSNEHLVKRIVEEGHTIGIHGYSHEYSKIYKSKEVFLSNVYDLQERIEKSTGVKTMYTRFPGGSSNTVSKKYCKGIMTELTKELLSRGFKYYDWNVSSGDAGGAKTAKDVYNNVTKNLSKKRGNMVLMHDFGGNKKGLEALPDIIKYAKKEGYTFAAIDDNTPMYAQHINN